MEQAVDVTRIVCQDGSLQAARERFVRFRCGVFMVCTGGECVISTGVTSFEMKCRAGLLFVTGTIVCLVRCSDDFRVRMRSLCHRFLGLVHEYAATEHGVNFYAGKLCISPRYLNRITSMYVDGLSPKKIIDDQLVAEIKVRLCDPSLSITEIAADLNFSDQTYMSTFFRRLTGISPVEYRRSVIG